MDESKEARPRCPDCGQELTRNVVRQYWYCECMPPGQVFTDEVIKRDPRFAPPAANKEVFTVDDRQKGPI